MSKKGAIKVYHGFGHKHDMEIFGHVFSKSGVLRQRYSRNPLTNMLTLFRLFLVKPVAKIPVQLTWQQQVVPSHTEYDGFFRFAWAANEETPAGLHEVEVCGADGVVVEPAKGHIFVPHITQFAFISDIDDTIMVSHSATVGKRLKELLFRNVKDRIIFPDAARHYQMLAAAHTTDEEPNPFFYVSSSEWNLYEYLKLIFKNNGLPDGAFLLNQVKRWYELWKTGKTKHSGKLLRILRILEVFPNQRFVLFGDNSQHDPEIYAKLTEKYAHRIFAIYIRNVSMKNEAATQAILDGLSKQGIHTCLFRDSTEAIDHSKAIGLIV